MAPGATGPGGRPAPRSTGGPPRRRPFDVDKGTRVTVSLGEDGVIAELNIEGEVDKEKLVEEVRPAPPLSDGPESGSVPAIG